MDQETQNFDTTRLKPRSELIPCYAVPAMFTLLSSFCIWTKNLTYISQLTSDNIISCCKLHSALCPLKMATAETSWELLYRFIHCATYIYICVCVCLYIYIYTHTHTHTHTHIYIYIYKYLQIHQLNTIKIMKKD